MSDVLWVKCDTEDESLLPRYQTSGSAGCDLRSAEDVIIKPGRRAVVSTGIKIELVPGFEAQVRPRSGLAANHGITVLNSPGTIDEDFRGLIKVILLNTGDEDFIIKKGDRIAQMVFSRIYRGIFQPSEKLQSTTRGEGGFGSTGRT
jgi:dUTP pyrophosphatase